MSVSISVRPPAVSASALAGGPVVAAMLFVSGAVALVYEVVWQRQFALLFGSGAPATAAVLAAYFAGLGAGAYGVGRVARRWTRPLRAYAVLEALIGAGALLVSPLLAWFEYGYPWLYGQLSDRPAAFMAARVAVAFGAVLLPTFCMGGTLPLLGRLVDANQHRLGVTAGWLYVVNTLGAALGALAVPFFFLPRFGLANTVWLCAAVNGAIAAAAWAMDRRGVGVEGAVTEERATAAALTKQRPPTSEEKRACARREGEAGGRSKDETTKSGAVLAFALMSGVVTFALQVLWNRAFAQVHENSMYSFAAIVAVVIFALAVGAQVARVALRRGSTIRCRASTLRRSCARARTARP